MDDTQKLNRRTFFVTSAVGVSAALAGCGGNGGGNGGTTAGSGSTGGSGGGDAGTSTSETTTATYENVYVKGTRMVDGDGNPVGVDAIDAGSGGELTVYPEKKGGGALKQRDATALLLRFAESDYQSPTNVDGTVKGYSAYSKVCTHQGCMVSSRSGTDNADLYCPCHGSQYDPRKGAEVVGGPAPRALPQLPVGLTSDGKFVIADGHFEGPIGPQ